MNPVTVHYLNLFLGSGAILLQVLVLVVLALLFIGPKRNKFLDLLTKHFLAIGFSLSLAASLFSLVYSEIINFLPCYLCWYQRVFMFPLVFIFGVAMWYRDHSVVKYLLPLSCVGFFISVYQNFSFYFGDTSSLPCDASGVSCYQLYISEFGGYIQIPMLALTSFVAILTLILVVHFYKRRVV